MPLFQLPQLISQLVNAQVAITRLREFLAAAEQHSMPETNPANSGWCSDCTETLDLTGTSTDSKVL